MRGKMLLTIYICYIVYKRFIMYILLLYIVYRRDFHHFVVFLQNLLRSYSWNFVELLGISWNFVIFLKTPKFSGFTSSIFLQLNFNCFASHDSFRLLDFYPLMKIDMHTKKKKFTQIALTFFYFTGSRF
jgi:hypothetical protein